MSKRSVGITLVAVTMFVILPTAVHAQESGRIRVSARVVSSVIPETRATIDQQLLLLVQAGRNKATTTNQEVETERGFARISTERLGFDYDAAADRAVDHSDTETEAGNGVIRITVAYTAN